MPARGNARSGGRGRGRGGKKNFGRFNTNSKSKKKSKGTSNNHRKPGPSPNDFPDLMDLSQNVYIPEYGASVPTNSLKNLSRRPGKSMMQEAMYTGSHHTETLNLPMRKRPMEFVKAKSTYDPSKELNKRLEEVLLKEEDPIKQENLVDDSYAIKEQAEPLKELEQVEEKLEASQEANTQHQIEIEAEKLELQVELELKPELELKSELEDAFEIDETGDEQLRHNVAKPKLSLIEGGGDDNIERDNTITIGKVTLQTLTAASGEMTTELMAIELLNRIARPGFVDEYVNSLNSDDEIDDLSDYDPRGYGDYVAQLMKQMKDDSDYASDEYESDTNFDIMAENSAGEGEAELEDDTPETDPEYGFLEEDYDFDISRISISNLRLGIQNQYYTSCRDLTGTTDPTWINEDDVKEFALENGVKEHRLQSFFKFLTKDFIMDDKDDKPYDSDIYISETSDDNDDGENYDSDNLGDLIAFAQTKPKAPEHIDLNPTRSVKTKGKGKKKRLDLNSIEMDADLRQSLQEQYITQRQAKRLRKLMKEEEAYHEGVSRHDLFIKYPYSLHIREIRDELETFLHDESRSTLKFPPLDPHGHKTVVKMATCFNFKSKKVGGNGLKLFIEIVKTKRTFQYIPDYNRIYAILKQRPVFNRIDQKRPKDEIIERDGNKDKDRRRGRDKSSNATFREGDIVGEKAPEISADNIGRKLLEKMGWSKGEGLGALGNQGINEPVIAKVKMSKLGLR